ncbi:MULTISPECIES: hypothetical protein [Gammaproteobacteria]|uniref:hypothetical protein n=1 Tax=Gammaproteobacteria TaxID=1236 RepID=UPI003A8D07D1
MQKVAIVALALALAGCGLKTNTFNPDGRGYAMKREAHSGPVCQLASPLPEGVPHEVIGLVRGNRGFFGGFGPVRQVMADEARSAGADAIVNLRMRQDVAFRGVFILRPVGEGMAVKLADPSAFNCLANGGRVYPGKGIAPIEGYSPASAIMSGATTYDECMGRVMRITDPTLRLQAMVACDDAK